MGLLPCPTTTWSSACKNFHGIHVSEVAALKQTQPGMDFSYGKQEAARWERATGD